jgi:hypothetical protein
MFPIGVPAAAPEHPAAGQLGCSSIWDSTFHGIWGVDRRPVAQGGAKQPPHSSGRATISRRFDRRLVRGLNLPMALEPAVSCGGAPMADKPLRPRTLQGSGQTAVGTIVVAMWKRRLRQDVPASAESCEAFEHRSPPFLLRFCASRRSVSVKVSDPLGAIAYPNAAAGAAIDLDVVRCRQPGRTVPVGATKGGTAHVLVGWVRRSGLSLA